LPRGGNARQTRARLPQAVAIALPLLALALQWMLWPWIRPFVWFLFFPTVFFSARLGGGRGGLVSTALSAVIVWFFFLPPQLSWLVENPANLWSVGMFVFVGCLVSANQTRLERANCAREAALAHALAAQTELAATNAQLRELTLHLEERAAERTAALRESEARFRFALEICHIGAWEVDLADQTAFRSLEHARIFGYDQLLPGWTRDRFLEHVLPEDRARVDGTIQRAVEAQSCFSLECRIQRADGQVRWIWIAGQYRAEGDGKVRHLAGIVQDITARKLAEDALRASEQQLQAAQAVAHLGSWHLDLVRDRLSWSAEVCRIFARSGPPATYPEFLACIHPDDLPLLQQAWQATLAGAPYDLQHRILAGGETRWVQQRAALEYDAQGRAVSCLGTVQDITARKEAEAKQAEQLRELQRWHDATLGREGRILELKREVNELLAGAGLPFRYPSVMAAGAEGLQPPATPP
jgi:PAS domain S-box-containing protein